MQTLLTSHQACMTCMHVHGTHALSKAGMSKQSSGLACMQADLNLVTIAAC